MFQKIEQKRKSPSISQMLNRFKKDNKNNYENIFSTKTLNYNQLNNKNKNMNNNMYNTNTMSQSNVSYMTSPQFLDYTIVNNEIKKKKTKGIFDVTSHRNRDIFIETDSEQYNSRRNSLDHKKQKKKNCSKLIVDKVSSLIPNNFSFNSEKRIIPNKQYSIKTYNNNFNINDIPELKDLDINDGYEYEKFEKIKIKKYYVPNGQNQLIN